MKARSCYNYMSHPQTGNHGSPIASIKYKAINEDVLIEIMLRLPIKSLLRLRTVCRFWRDVIDSPYFRKLHTLNDNNLPDDTVYIQISFDHDDDIKPNKVLVNLQLQHNHKDLMSYEYANIYWELVPTIVGSVKGLICINPRNITIPIAICNPFLGQVKNLPLTSFGPSCKIGQRSVAIGFDEDYKVVQVLTCLKHRCLHAQLYSRTADSWRELAVECSITYRTEFYNVSPIKSSCKNGHFAHWCMGGHGFTSRILSFDMKNEVFRIITLPFVLGECSIFAEDEHSFRYFSFGCQTGVRFVKICESRCEGSKFSWNRMMIDASVPFAAPDQWRAGFVFFELQSCKWGSFVYDYRAREFVCRHYLPSSNSRFIECKGSFVSV
ncbi:F-box protein At5g65850-like [Salvia splendens]|uniref:F-box protein At5g65850-like n=1 Tax=Salvia splendens TaxID=180675 RepID=UPI0011056CF3|nr:F-box protein At5g65850-like [Salvia splendens]